MNGITKKELSAYAGYEIHRDIIVVGAGASLRDHKEAIVKFINVKNLISIGVNKVTEFIIPDYHLWTNNQRLRDQHGCINSSSNLMLGCGIVDNLVEEVARNYTKIDYVSEPELIPLVREGVIYGHYRTAGLLAIMIANILNSGTGRIYAVGMDGFCLHTQEDLLDNKENQHCYGKGFTDDATYGECLEKDRLIQDGLDKLRDAGVDFSIITPTKYDNHYDKNVLGLDTNV